MQTKATTDIRVKERQRKVIDPIAVSALADSIADKGLFHPILLEEDEETIAAGLTRFHAIRLLAGHDFGFIGGRSPALTEYRHGNDLIPTTHIPFVSMKGLSGLRAKEAEFEENDLRTDFTWQERTESVAMLHDLRTAQAAERGEKHTVHDTAKEVERKVDHVKEELLLSRHMDDPEVQKAKTKQDALKVVNKKLEKKHRENLAAQFDLNKLKTPHKLIKGDLFQVMPVFPANFFDLIIGDPPYGIDADQFNNQAAERHTYSDDVERSNAIYEFIAKEGMRVTKAQAHMYLFLDVLRFPTISVLVEMAGWYVWKWPLIWSKGSNNGIAPRPEHAPRRTYEGILYAIKGDKKHLVLRPDVLSQSGDKTVERGAHKSPFTYADLIERSCTAGQTVLDPCCGAGTVFPAASHTRTIATGIEISDDGYALSLERLKEPMPSLSIPGFEDAAE